MLRGLRVVQQETADRQSVEKCPQPEANLAHGRHTNLGPTRDFQIALVVNQETYHDDEKLKLALAVKTQLSASEESQKIHSKTCTLSFLYFLLTIGRSSGVSCLYLLILTRRIFMTDKTSDLVQGTLDMLILKTLALEPMHGYGITLRLEQMSRGTFRINAGSLFVALQRLERAGVIKSEWKATENSRRGKYYILTQKGRRRLDNETREWGRQVAAIARILEA
jgi:PadR family transcriptional regulator PadR